MKIEDRVRRTLHDRAERVSASRPSTSSADRSGEHSKPALSSSSLGSTRRRVIAGTVALATFAAASVLLWRGFHPQEAVAPASVVGSPVRPAFGDGRVSFEPSPGWNVLQGGALSACATTASFAPDDVAQSGSLGPNDLLGCRATAASLPSDGVLINVNTFDRYAWAIPGPNFPAGALPPTLDPASCGARTFEGQPAGTSECHVWITANDRQLVIYVFLGTESPGSALMKTVQAGLNSLQVSEPASLGNDIAFQPRNGWYDEETTQSSGRPEFDLPAAWTSSDPLAPYSGQYLPAGPSNAEIAHLAADAVIVSVEQDPSKNPTDQQGLTLPIDLSKGRLIPGGWEGMAATDVSQIYLGGVVNGRPVIVQAFFHTLDPSRKLIRKASIGLARLVVVPSG